MPRRRDGASRPTIVGVFAHPDDESLACGGTLARLADQGVRVVVICATNGERGAATGPARDDALGRARIAEVRAAAAALGVSDLLLLNHPDGDLRWAAVTDFHAEITFAIRSYSPDAVITFGEDGLYWHPDHIAVYERTTTALRTLGEPPPALYCVTMPRGVMRPLVDLAVARGWAPPAKGFWSLTPDAFGLSAAPPSLVVDVTPWTGRKLAALQAHASQLGAEAAPFAQLDGDAARRWLAVEHFHVAPGTDRISPLLENLCT